MKRTFSFAGRVSAVLGLCIAAANASAQPGATHSVGSVVIPDGTVVKLRLKTAVSSESATVGISVPVELAEDLVVDGVVVATRNTPVPTVVKTATPAKRFHGNGTLELEFQGLVLANGTQLRLRQDEAAASRKRRQSRPPLVHSRR